MSTTVLAVELDSPVEAVSLPLIHKNYIRDLTHVGIGRMDFEICWEAQCQGGLADIWLTFCYLDEDLLIKAPGQGLRVKLEGDELDLLKAKTSACGISHCAGLMQAVLEVLQACAHIGSGSIVQKETG